MPEQDLTDPATHRHWVDEGVRFSDTDAVGHVNNVAYAAYVESGRVAYVFDLARQLDAPTLHGIVLRRLEVDYLGEAHYPARLRVGSRLLGIGRTSLTVGTGVFVDRRCVATARSVLVVVGPDGPAPIPDEARPALQEEIER